MEEIFRTIIGFDDYLISNFGRVKTKERMLRYTHSKTGNEHFRKTECRFLMVRNNNLTGYKFVQLYKNKKMFNRVIHRLVAEAFIDNPNKYLVVNHKDGNKHNNTIENLEWCTNAYNHKHATETGLKVKGESVGTSKLTQRCVNAIRYLAVLGLSHTEISKAFGVSRPTISLIIENKIWKTSLTGQELNIN